MAGLAGPGLRPQRKALEDIKENQKLLLPGLDDNNLSYRGKCLADALKVGDALNGTYLYRLFLMEHKKGTADGDRYFGTKGNDLKKDLETCRSI